MKHRFGKRFTALMLSAILLISVGGYARAEVLKLPAGIIAIEDEAFFGDRAMKAVDIPWGAESIGSRAFADSGVIDAYIPDTVQSIAVDAFDGTDVTIHSSADAYARFYAAFNGIAWEDVDGKWQDEQVENATLADCLIEDPELTPISKAGISDKQLIQKIDAYNAAVAELNRLIPEYNANLLEAIDHCENPERVFEGLSIEETDSGGCVMQGEDFYFTIDGDALDVVGENCQVRSTEMGADGTVRIELIDAAGVPIYVTAMDGQLTVSRQPYQISNNRALTAPAIHDSPQGLRAPISHINKAYQIASTLNDGTKAVGFNIAEKANELVYNSFAMQDRANLTPKQLEILEKIGPTQNKLNNVVPKIKLATDIMSPIINIYEDTDRWWKLKAIIACGHPDSGEMDDESFRLAMSMMADVRDAMDALSIDGVLSFATALLSARTGGKVYEGDAQRIKDMLSFLDGMTGLTSSAVTDYLYQSAMDKHALLHYELRGFVYDAETGKPIRDGVKISCQASGHQTLNRTTDGSGSYSFDPLSDHVNLLLSHEEYQDKNYPLPDGTHWLAYDVRTYVNIEMTPKKGWIKGVVYDKHTRKPISSAEVVCEDVMTLTDSNGYFSLEVRMGQREVIAKAPEYDCDPVSVNVTYKDERVIEIPMSNAHEIWNRQDLVNVANDPEGRYVLCADIDLSNAVWTPLPNFSGIFRGQNHIISGMVLRDCTWGNMGLFNNLVGAEVDNLTLKNCTIDSENHGNISEFTNVGMLSGGMENGTRVTNCKVVNANIYITNPADWANIGGLAGYSSNAQLLDCSVQGTIDVSTDRNANVCGIAAGAEDSMAKNCDANVKLTLTQSGDNADAMFSAYGTGNFNNLSEGCDVEGMISVEAKAGRAYAYACYRSTDASNKVRVTARSTGSEAHAYGCYQGSNMINSGEILAEAEAMGAEAIGLFDVKKSENHASVTARTESGDARARGFEGYCSHVSNYGEVHAESVDGSVEAIGINSDPDETVGFACFNHEKVWASSENNMAEATGLAWCINSGNDGKILAESKSRGGTAFGLRYCEYSSNNGNVEAYITGTASGNFDAAATGLDVCTACINYGKIRGEVQFDNREGRLGVAKGASDGGRYNVNRGSVEAHGFRGALAEGVSSNDSQNYGSVLANSQDGWAQAYGVRSDNCLNVGDVKAQTAFGHAMVWGESSSDSVSTGLAWTETTAEQGDAHSYNSSRSKATWCGFDTYASDGKHLEIIRYTPQAGCSKGHIAGIFQRPKNDSGWDNCMKWLSAAESKSYPAYQMPEVPPAPVDPDA